MLLLLDADPSRLLCLFSAVVHGRARHALQSVSAGGWVASWATAARDFDLTVGRCGSSEGCCRCRLVFLVLPGALLLAC